MRFGISLLAALVAATLLGCAEQGPQRYNISGEVTYKGEPIPAGVIQFVPDTAAGNSGPSGQATIVDGKYDTAVDGSGVVGGPHVVTIQAFNGEPQPELALPNGYPLFYDYRERMDLPTEEPLTRNIDVPQQREVRRGAPSRGEPFTDEV